MITKQIERSDGFNIAIIEKLYTETGDMVVTLQQIDTDEEGNQTFVKQDSNIIMPSGSIELTEEEMEILNPTPQAEHPS